MDKVTAILLLAVGLGAVFIQRVGGFDNNHTDITVVEFANNKNGFTATRCLCFADVSRLWLKG